MDPIFPTEEQQATPAIFPEQAPSIVPPRSEEQMHTTANLAALAYNYNKDSNESFATTSSRFEQMITDGREEEVRQQVGAASKNATIQDLQKEQGGLLNTPYAPGLAQAMKDSMDKQALVQMNGPEHSAVEKDGVRAIQSMGLSDTKQANIAASHAPDVFQTMAENTTKAAIFNRELDALSEEVKKEGVAHKIVDFFALPMQNIWAQHHAIPGVGGILPSTTIYRDLNQLWSLPAEEFEKQLPVVIANIRNSSGIFAENPSLALSILQNFGRSGAAVNAFNANIWGAVDLASMPGMGKVLKAAGSAAGLMRAVGNRTGAIASLTGDILKDQQGLAADAAGVPTIHTPVTTIGELMPSVSTPKLVGEAGGLSGDLARKLTNLTTATNQTLRDLRLRLNRLSPEQYQAALEATEAKLAKRLEYDHVLDIKDAKIVKYSETVGARAEASKAELESMPDRAVALSEVKRDDLTNVNEHGEIESFENEGGAVTPAYRKIETTVPGRQATDIERLEGEGGMIPELAAQKVNAFPPGVFEHGIDDATGLRFVSALVGDHAGEGGYETFEAAMQGVKERGWDPQDINIVKIDNQFAIRVTQAVPETSVLTPAMKARDLPSTFHGFIFFKNANDVLHEMFAGGLLRQTHIAAAIQDKVAKPLLRNIQKLSARSRKAVASVIELGTKEENAASQTGFGRWYNPNEFMEKFAKVKGRAPTEKEVLSYYSYKELYDMDYMIRNDLVYTSKARQGWGTISVTEHPKTGFKVDRTNGRVIERPRFNDIDVYDHETGKIIEAGKMGAKTQRRWESGNYHVLELEANKESPDGDSIQYVLAPKDSSTSGPLARQQLPYVPGGQHRQYRGKWFTKQAVSVTQASGKEGWIAPLTHSNHLTERAATEYAATQEEARQLYNQILDRLSVRKGPSPSIGKRTYQVTPEEQMVFQRSGAGSFQKFHDLVKAGRINRDHPFEALYDKTMPTAMAQRDPGMYRWFNQDMPEYERELITRGQMYYSPQGEHLLDEFGKEAPVLNPFKTLDRALSNAMKTKALWDYNTRVVEEWSRMAEDAGLLDTASLGNDRSPQRIFSNGKLKITQRGNAQQADAYQALENMRTVHKRLLNYKTTEMAQADMAVRRFANFVEGKMGGVGDWLASKAFDINDARPIQALRAFVYDTTIGMFNPVRLWLHSMTGAAAMTVHPVYGRAAGYMAPFMRLLDHNRSDALLDHISSWGKTVTGLDAEEFKSMVREYRRSGISTTGNDQIMLDSSGVLKWAGNFRDRGRVFMKMAEGFNRSVGWQIAWRKAIDEMPEAARDSDAFLARVHTIADDMTNNQTVASRSGWQTGWASTVTQFMQFQARLLERMLPRMVGGSNRATAAMKVRLAAGQSIFYGAAGLPLAGSLIAVAKNQYEQSTGQVLDDNTWRTASKGLFDSLLHFTTGSDTDVADRAGIGAAWGHVWDDAWNGRMESVIQMATGPSGEILDQGYQTWNKVALYLRSQQIDQLEPEQFGLIAMDLTKFMQTMSVAQKEYWMMKTGWLMDAKTGQAVVPVDLQDKILAAWGIPLRVERERLDYINSEEARSDLARSTGKTLSEFNRNAVRAIEDGDEAGTKYWSNLAAGLMQPYRNDPTLQQEILRQANQLDKQINPEWDNMLLRIQKNTGIRQEFK